MTLKYPCDKNKNIKQITSFFSSGFEKVFAQHLTPVVRRVASDIHWITQLVLRVFIRLRSIYPVDSGIHLLNNWGLTGKIWALIFIQRIVPQRAGSGEKWRQRLTSLKFQLIMYAKREF